MSEHHEHMNGQAEPQFINGSDVDTDTSSIDSTSSPLVNKFSRPYETPHNIAPVANVNTNPDHKDLSFLASANFSTDSLVEADEDLLYAPNEPSTPTFSNILTFNDSTNDQSVHGRRYSVSSLNSPINSRQTPSTRSRPMSAYFSGDAAVRIDESIPSLQSPSANSRVGRQNHHQRGAGYVPPPIIAPSYPSRSGSPTRSSSPTRTNKHFRSKSPVRRAQSPTKSYQPFNFKSQEVMMNNGNTSTLTVKPAHRKGHKYKHSSVSMNYFQEPSPALSMTSSESVSIPDSYPIPTTRELINSITKDQKIKLCWSMVHLMLSLIVFVSSYRIQVAELSTLAHLIFYDSLGCMVIVLVDILSNFNVWNNASIVYPFGLGRLEVLIGFGLGASLVMVGFDLLSHVFEEFIVYFFEMSEENTHNHHHVHNSEEESPSKDSFIYYSVTFSTVIITLITSNYILAAEKINTIIKDNSHLGHSRNVSNIGILDEGIEDIRENKYLEKFNKFTNIITKNPTYILTLSYTAFLILSPWISGFVSKQLELDVNEVASVTISLLFCLTGWKLVKALGETLLLSYPSSHSDYNKLKYSITRDIINFDSFKKGFAIENLFISKFNYDTFVVGIKISMHGGSIDNESNLKFEISRLITKKIQKRQRSNFKLEITIEVDRD